MKGADDSSHYPSAEPEPPSAEPPTDEELEGWKSLVKYIKSEKGADLLVTAINVGMEAYQLELNYVNYTREQAEYHKNQLWLASEDAQVLLNQGDGGVHLIRQSMERIVQNVKLDYNCRTELDHVTAELEATKVSIEEIQNDRNSYLKEKEKSENVLKRISSIAIFPVGDSLHFSRRVGDVLTDPRFDNIKTIAFIPGRGPVTPKQHAEQEARRVEAEQQGRIFVVRAATSPPTSPKLPTPSP